jgi:hypothetical protein
MTQLPHSCRVMSWITPSSAKADYSAAHSAFSLLSLASVNATNIEGYNYPPADVVTAFESTRQHSESLEHIMKITLYNIQVGCDPRLGQVA